MDASGNLYKTSPEMQRELEKMSGRKLIPLSENQFQELEPMSRPRRKNTMRNKPCLCGSGIKFKRCCWSKYA
jgi:hypothetical protein